MKLVTHPNNAGEEREPPLPPALPVAGGVDVTRADPGTAAAQS